MIRLMTEQNLLNAERIWKTIPDKMQKDMCVMEKLMPSSENPLPSLTPAQKFMLIIKYRSDIKKVVR